MTDFLSRLVERSFGTAPAIRPRVSSLFEPVSRPAATEAAKPQALVDQAEEQSGSIPVESRTQSPPAAPLHENGAGTGEREKVPDVPLSRGRAVDVKPVSDWAATRDTVLEPKPDRRGIARDRPLGEPVAAPRHPEIAVAHVTRVPAGAGQRSAPGQTSQRVPDDARKANDERGLVVPSPAAARVAADLQQTAAALHGTARRRSDDAHAIATPIHAPSERDVHVTIGRIEVRAVTSGKAPTREHSASPVMSLDAYLQRQSRRGAE